MPLGDEQRARLRQHVVSEDHARLERLHRDLAVRPFTHQQLAELLEGHQQRRVDQPTRLERGEHLLDVLARREPPLDHRGRAQRTHLERAASAGREPLEQLEDAIEAGNALEDLRGHAGRARRERPLCLGEHRPLVEPLRELGAQADGPQLREGRGHLQLPAARQPGLGGQQRDDALEPPAPAEGSGVGEREQLRERVDAARHRALEQLLLGAQQASLLERRLERAHQRVAAGRLDEEAEDVAVVDGPGGGLEVRVAREHQPHGVWPPRPRAPEELVAVHARHAHVADDDVEVGLLEVLQRGVGGCREREPVARLEHAVNRQEHVLLVVDEEDVGLIRHGEPPARVT